MTSPDPIIQPGLVWRRRSDDEQVRVTHVTDGNLRWMSAKFVGSISTRAFIQRYDLIQEAPDER